MTKAKAEGRRQKGEVKELVAVLNSVLRPFVQKQERIHFAAAAMKGMLANPIMMATSTTRDEIARDAWGWADRMLSLEKGEAP